MELKTKLEEEILFIKSPRPKLIINHLNKKGIFTVEDFINCDVEQMSSNSIRRKEFRAYQGILKYKYLGTPLVVDVLLEKEINGQITIRELTKALNTLGFNVHTNVHTENLSWDSSTMIKMIDYIRHISSGAYDNLKDFYIEYYDTQIKKQNSEEDIVESDKSSLEMLKTELISLVSRRDELNEKIKSLSEKINSLEGNKVNGKK